MEHILQYKKGDRMKTFNRYCVHFFGISSIALLMFLILLKIDESELFSPIFVLIMLGCMIFFSLPMALFYTKMAKLELVVIESEDVDVDMMKIDKLIKEKFQREYVQEAGRKKIYKCRNKYHAWLTNPITVEQREQRICISIPKCFCEVIRQMFPTSSVTMK